ncbi:hypothetical protein ACLSZ3_06230 [Avibacterium gallinarum]|nr:hypothetical protein [Avibacterium endocarditidis]
MHKKSKREETLRLTRLATMDVGRIKLAELTEQEILLLDEMNGYRC